MWCPHQNLIPTAWVCSAGEIQRCSTLGLINWVPKTFWDAASTEIWNSWVVSSSGQVWVSALFSNPRLREINCSPKLAPVSREEQLRKSRIQFLALQIKICWITTSTSITLSPVFKPANSPFSQSGLLIIKCTINIFKTLRSYSGE